MTEITESKNYLQTLETIKEQVKTAQIKAHLSVNKEMLILYWQIGKTIVERQEKEGWGAKIIDRLAKDLSSEFPQMTGLSARNLKYMRKFAENYPDLLIVQENNEFVQAPLAQIESKKFYSDYANVILGITWYHNLALLEKVNDKTHRLWYAQKTIENGWSRNVLVTQINTKLYDRQATREIKTNNFDITLPQEDSELINEVFKDEYNFEFIDNSKGRLKEREIENALIDDVIKFLTELGKGFAFVGKQYHLSVDGQDFYCDLLFYQIKLKSYICIELKSGAFKPEYVGKMGFYLACIDDYLKDEKDNYSIGIILCQDEGKNKEIKKKSLKCMMRPIGVSTYKLADKKELPEELKPIEDLKNLLKDKE